MPLSPERNPNPKPRSPVSPDDWLKEQSALKHVALKMRLHCLSLQPPYQQDLTAVLSDELLLLVFSKVPQSHGGSSSLVCKRWLSLQGRLVRSLKVLDWEFLKSGRLVRRFPNLTHLDLVSSCISPPRNYGISATHRLVSTHIDSQFSPYGFISKGDFMPPEAIDKGLRELATGFPNLRKLALIGSGVEGLSYVAQMCPTLQELELHCCTVMSLKAISVCRNLQILKLIGCIDGFYSSVVTDIELTILAQGCQRLVKLELVGCEGSYDGIKAIGHCCQMLEELTLRDHRMDGGWLSALAYCANLKTLKLQSCKNIDLNPGTDEHLGVCSMLEELHLQQCQLKDKLSVRALLLVCKAVREINFVDCWGLNNDSFSSASVCRRVKCLSLEGCSLLTMEGFDNVVFLWNELQRLRVVSCKNIKDSEVTPAVAELFSVLVELKWQPAASKSLLSSSLAGNGVRRKGGRFFKWS